MFWKKKNVEVMSTPENEKTMQFYQQMKSEILRNNKLNFIFCVVFAFAQAVLVVIVATFFQKIIDATNALSMTKFIKVVIGFVIYFILVICISFAEREVKNNFIRKGLVNYKAFAFRKLMTKNISTFINASSSTYISALTNDVNLIETEYIESITGIIYQLGTLVVALVVMFRYSGWMTLIALVLCIMPMVLAAKVGSKLVDLEKKVSDKNENFVATVRDVLSGFTVIKSFKAEKQVTEIFDESNKKLEDDKNVKRKELQKIQIVTVTAGTLVEIVVFSVGALFAIKGFITSGVVVAFIPLINDILEPINTLPVLFSKYNASSELMHKLAKGLSEEKIKSGNIEKKELDKGIFIRQLQFGYDEDKNVLNGINLTFDYNKSYAIVGLSGSGKSTLLNLLLGGYDDYDGVIQYDDCDLRDISEESLFDLVSIIQQNVIIFDSTVVNNITMFRDFTQKEVDEAIEKAGLADFIKNKGPLYNCGENGRGLSGGEKQRISIARCLLRDTPILLLDEATAALDVKTSYIIEDAILNLKDRLRIVITHKLQADMLKRYDEIIVLNDGNVVEKGTYEDLYSMKGKFYSMMEVGK